MSPYGAYWSPANKLQWTLNKKNPDIFFQGITFENVVRKLRVILSLPQSVDNMLNRRKSSVQISPMIWSYMQETNKANKPRDLSLVLYWSWGINADTQIHSRWLKRILPLDYDSGNMALYNGSLSFSWMETSSFYAEASLNIVLSHNYKLDIFCPTTYDISSSAPMIYFNIYEVFRCGKWGVSPVLT